MPPFVIASTAKQSRLFPRLQSGLLRKARNDGEGIEVPSKIKSLAETELE